MKKSPIEMRNPFIITPGEFWADRESLWKRIIDRIELARHTRSNEIIVLTGTYGCGTTHTLRYLRKFLDEKDAVAAYVSTPIDSSLRSLYRIFLQQIDPQKRENVIDGIIKDLYWGRDKEEGEIPRLADDESEDIRTRLIPIIMGERSTRTLTLRTRRMVEATIGRIPTVLELWSRFILDLGTREWPVFILLDEFDVALFRGLSGVELTYNLRRLYDESLAGLCIIIGLKGEPKDAREKLGSALYSRMTFQPIHLHLLSKFEGLEFLTAIMRHAHARAKKKSPSPYFPFTKKSVETLIELTCPAPPRRLLKVSSLIFEQARLERLSAIDADFVLKVAMMFGEVSMRISAKKAKPLKVVETREEIPEIPSQNLRGIIQFGRDNVPNLMVDPEKLTAREVIGLMRYAKAPSSINLGELRILVSRNWRSVPGRYITANLAQMRKLIIREGARGSYEYSLSGIGKSWIKNELIPKLRFGKRKEA